MAHNALMSTPATNAAISLGAFTSENSIRIHADVRGAPRGSVLLLAVVESGLGATPTAGENAGRNLLHSNVVRTVKQLPASSADVVIELPKDLNTQSSSIIGLIQDSVSMRITAAAQILISGRAAASDQRPSCGCCGRCVPGIQVQACSTELCIPGVAARKDSFHFVDIPPGTYTISVGATSPSSTIALAKGASLTLPPIVESSRQ